MTSGTSVRMKPFHVGLLSTTLAATTDAGACDGMHKVTVWWRLTRDHAEGTDLCHTAHALGQAAVARADQEGRDGKVS